MAAVMMLPPNEVWPEMQRLQTEVESLKATTGTNASGYTPYLTYFSVWSLQRKVQALRIIEAIRHHGSTHDGQFPKSLDDIEDVAIPIDPLTNQPFSWEVTDTAAKLEAPPLPADAVSLLEAGGFSTTLRYQLLLK